MTYSAPMRKLWISENAWEYLAMTASSNGWVRGINTQSVFGPRTRNINRFFAAISALEYVDIRGPNADTSIWSDGVLLRRRHVILTDEIVNNFQLIALIHRIPPRQVQTYILQERRPSTLTTAAYADTFCTYSPVALMGAVLEAIGLRYLEPARGFPHAPPDLFAQPAYKPPAQSVIERIGLI